MIIGRGKIEGYGFFREGQKIKSLSSGKSYVISAIGWGKIQLSDGQVWPIDRDFFNRFVPVEKNR